MKTLSSAIWLFVFLGWTKPAGKAEELLLSRPPNTSDLAQALRSDQYYEAPGYPRQQMADRFSLENSSLVTGLTWWGFYLPAGTAAPPQQVQFRIQLFPDSNGSPSPSSAYDITVFANLSPFIILQGHPTYRFSVALSVPFRLEKEAGYWLSIRENDVRTDGSFDWFNSGPARWRIGWASRPSDADPWLLFENTEQMSFSLTGSLDNAPPVAIAAAVRPLHFPPLIGGDPELLTVISPNGVDALVVLDGSASFDPDGDVLFYEWWSDGAFAHTAIATNRFPVGRQRVRLTVGDGVTSSTDVIDVMVLSAANVARWLRDVLNDAAAPRPARHSLTLPLRRAEESFEGGDPAEGLRQMEIFRKRVLVQPTGTDTPTMAALAGLAQELIQTVQR